MRVWMDRGDCFAKSEGAPIRVRSQDVEVTLDGEKFPPVFEADDQEGWALVALGEMGREGSPLFWCFIPDSSSPYGCKTEIRRGKVEIRLK